MSERWLDMERTLDFIRAVTGSPMGPACQTLITICEAGTVRACWTMHHSGTAPAIHKRDWIGADIDWQTFRVGKADGAFMRGVSFSVAELEAWADSRAAAADPPAVLPAQPTAPADPMAACRALIEANPTMPREPLCHLARQTIHGLSKKDFGRVWKATASLERQRGGRPMST